MPPFRLFEEFGRREDTILTAGPGGRKNPLLPEKARENIRLRYAPLREAGNRNSGNQGDRAPRYLLASGTDDPPSENKPSFRRDDSVSRNPGELIRVFGLDAQALEDVKLDGEFFDLLRDIRDIDKRNPDKNQIVAMKRRTIETVGKQNPALARRLTDVIEMARQPINPENMRLKNDEEIEKYIKGREEALNKAGEITKMIDKIDNYLEAVGVKGGIRGVILKGISGGVLGGAGTAIAKAPLSSFVAGAIMSAAGIALNSTIERGKQEIEKRKKFIHNSEEADGE
jgi:hypothetical protein